MITQTLKIDSLTTLRLDEEKSVVVSIVESGDDLLSLQERFASLSLIGAGSNSIINPNATEPIIKLGDPFNHIEVRDSCLIAGAATPLVKIAKTALRLGWSGFEWMIAVPGTVGGAVAMNAGTPYGTTGECLRAVTVFDRTEGLIEKTVAPTDFSYRWSPFRTSLVTAATFIPKDRNTNPRTIRDAMRSIQKVRARKFPLHLPNCGSVFLRPESGKGPFSGYLIESAGCKGMQRGNVAVDKTHANFFVNLGSGTTSDFVNLASEVQEAVFAKHGIALEREVHFFGLPHTEFERARMSTEQLKKNDQSSWERVS